MYFIMDCKGEYPPTAIAGAPFFETGPWLSGEPVEGEVPSPLEYTLDPKRPGNVKAFYKRAQPLMRTDLLDALRSAGVDNLQLYPAVLVDPTTGQRHENFRAVNVIGLVQSVDESRSARTGPGIGPGDATYDSVTLDPARPDGLLLFRLAENFSAIVVHDRVRREVEARGIPGMIFYAEGEWSSL